MFFNCTRFGRAIPSGVLFIRHSCSRFRHGAAVDLKLDNKQCRLCLEMFDARCILYASKNCDHWFHQACFDRSLRRGRMECPVCHANCWWKLVTILWIGTLCLRQNLICAIVPRAYCCTKRVVRYKQASISIEPVHRHQLLTTLRIGSSCQQMSITLSSNFVDSKVTFARPSLRRLGTAITSRVQ